MIVLDTDHHSILRYTDHPQCRALRIRLDTCGDERIETTAITFEEQMRGWLVRISKNKDVHLQVETYGRLVGLIEQFSDWGLTPFDNRAASEFTRWRKAGVRIGTQDLKIASIALTQDALLLSANLKDFRQVPGLRVENWLA